MRVLVTDSGWRSGALSAARSLHAAGWDVGLGLPGGRGYAASSRAVARAHSVPSPEMDLRGFVTGVNAAVADARYEVVLPSSDLDMLALSAERENVDAVVPYGDHDGVVRAVDKLDSTEAARAAGFAAPRTAAAGDYDLSAVDAAHPVVVKARRHVFLDRGSGTEFKVAVVCRNAAEVETRARLVAAEGGEAVVQELVHGRLAALSVVTDASFRPVALAYQEAQRTWPEPVGGTARGITLRPPPELVARAEAMLADLRWIGLAQLQFLVTDDGRASFIDFNGRIYGSIALATRAGANLPASWGAVATGRHAGPTVVARAGARFHWLEGDLKRAVLGSPRKLVPRLLDSFAYAARAAHSVSSLRDPLPAFRYAGVLAARMRTKGITRGRSGAGSRTS